MKLTILYDNTAWDKRLAPGWGFACLVEAHDKRILFDTGDKGDPLLENMKKMGVAPDCLDALVISHDHWDHTGGLADILTASGLDAVYVPTGVQPLPGVKTIVVDRPMEIFSGIRSTGTLAAVEQSLVVTRPDRSVVVVVGCSHPGVEVILDAARRVGPVSALVGGLHGFDDFKVIEGIPVICPTHCTKFIPAIRDLYPDAFVEGGAGRVLEF